MRDEARQFIKSDAVCETALPDDIVQELQSPDETVRAKAVRKLCPCSHGWAGFETHLQWAHQLTKDPSPLVRAAALHVFEDAAQMQSDGLPTNPREAHNELLRTRRASRFARDADDIPTHRRAKRAREIRET